MSGGRFRTVTSGNAATFHWVPSVVCSTLWDRHCDHPYWDRFPDRVCEPTQANVQACASCGFHLAACFYRPYICWRVCYQKRYTMHHFRHHRVSSIHLVLSLIYSICENGRKEFLRVLTPPRGLRRVVGLFCASQVGQEAEAKAQVVIGKLGSMGDRYTLSVFVVLASGDWASWFQSSHGGQSCPVWCFAFPKRKLGYLSVPNFIFRLLVSLFPCYPALTVFGHIIYVWTQISCKHV